MRKEREKKGEMKKKGYWPLMILVGKQEVDQNCRFYEYEIKWVYEFSQRINLLTFFISIFNCNGRISNIFFLTSLIKIVENSRTKLQFQLVLHVVID